MATTSIGGLFGRRDVHLLGVVVAVQLCLLAGYFAVRPEEPVVFRYTLYPFVWINVALLAAVHVEVPDASFRHRVAASAVASGYFLLLLSLSGLVGVPGEDLLAVSGVVDVQAGSPGTERLHLVTDLVYVSFIPYRTIGFLVLAYLVYVTLLDLSGSIAAGALGLFTCVGCAFPILVSLSAALFGGTAVASAVYGAQFDISTVVFALAIGLLYWRPAITDRLGSIRAK